MIITIRGGKLTGKAAAICAWAALLFGFGTSGRAATLTDDYLITTWEVEAGLPENSATAMVQSDDGFLWFGTFNGLARFDGLEFKVHTPENQPGLPSAAIVNLHLQPSGTMWISTDRGIVSRSGDTWRRHGEAGPWLNRIVRNFAAGRDGVLYATGFKGAICRLEPDGLTDLPVPVPERPLGGYHAVVDPAGKLWALRSDYFGSWDGASWVMADSAQVVTNGFRGAAPARDGGAWVLTRERLIKLMAGQVVSSVPLSVSTEDYWSMYEDYDGMIWVASYRRGAYRISQKGEVVRFSKADGLSDDALRFIMRGLDGNLWLGSSGGGLMRLRPRLFKTFGTETNLTSRVVKSVAEESPGRMLLGTFGGGVIRLDLTETAPVFSVLGDGSRFAQSVLVDRQGRRWVGCHDGAPVVTLPGGESLTRDDEPAVTRVRALFESSGGDIWIGGVEGVTRERDGVRTLVGQPGGMSVRAVRGFGENPVDGIVWAACGDGVYRLTEDGFAPLANSEGRSLTNANALHFETDGTLWVGTENRGLLRFRAGRWSDVAMTHGLPSNKVAGLADDGAGNLWLASDRGIVRVSLSSLRQVADGVATRIEGQVFAREDGLVSGECHGEYQPGICRDQAGRLWFATIKGVAMVDPARFVLETNTAPVSVESVRYVDRHGEARAASGAAAGLIEIPPGSSQFEVKYVSPNFSAPDKLRYSHRLLRGRELVHESGTELRFARFTGLPPGDYRLELRAANHHGVSQAVATVVGISLQPYFWQTLTFKVVAVLVALTGMGFILWRVRGYELRMARRQLKTERELADQLRERDDRWRLAMDVARIETWDWNLQTGTVIGSPGLRDMFGGPSVHRLDSEREYHEFIHPDDESRVAAGIKKAVSQRRLYHEEFRVIWQDGSIHWIEGRGEVFADPDGNPVRLVGVSMDITSRRQAEVGRREMEARLQESQKLESLGVLAGGIAHDFNNLLTAMLGNVGLIKFELPAGSPHFSLLEDVERAALRAADLCSQMLAYSGRGRFVVKPVDVSRLIRDVVQMLKISVGKSTRLKLNLGEGLRAVMADATQLNQVIMNLVINAAEAIGSQPGEIVVTSEECLLDGAYLAERALGDRLTAGRHLRIVVEDTGPGMDEETLRRVFEPFFTTKFTGRGLGLAAVQGIVRGHHGVLQVRSEPGRGTTFTLLLPALDASSPPAEERASMAVMPTGENGRLVLVVDDEDIVRDTTTAVLRRFGYQVVAAVDGEDGVRCFDQYQDQLVAVLLDLAMPRMDGVEAFKRIRGLQPGIPVLLMSGYSESVAIQRFEGEGLDGFLQKPFTNNVLLNKLGGILGETFPSGEQG